MTFWTTEALQDAPWRTLLAVAVVIVYPLLCSSLRYRRVKAQHREFGFRDRESLSKMTNVQAQRIVRELNEMEFPFMITTALQFALFKTYGIPTISKLLVATRMFSHPAHASKRYEDTAVLIGEFIGHGPDEARTRQAIARMNSIHDPYIKAGKISNEDMLYTLGVILMHQIQWVNSYEWRQLTDMELCAFGTFWKSIGHAMSIEYKGFLARDSWRDAIEFVDDLSEWTQRYEREHMVPAATNQKTATELVSLLLHPVPKCLLSFSRDAISTMMDDRLRNAMMFENPSKTVQLAVRSALGLRRFLLRHLCLPRFSRELVFSDQDPRTGRYHHLTYLVHPYYVKPTFSNRWGWSALIHRAMGGIVPGGRDGEKYLPEGYHFADVGPDKKQPFGAEDLSWWEKQVERSLPLGCPFVMNR